ncbi:hypothetical protein TI39_contig5876g00004 [Zymoseptoria brevis]|uniref:Uncharacterized protein n=1 Tax=Zymoseptoria brevis TaxID=1047168 RepID=A0A0F4G4M6_9PEZI|nr:hypothetical protein TI39_contig5876g00004 [Zymoseptoria brevis]
MSRAREKANDDGTKANALAHKLVATLAAQTGIDPDAFILPSLWLMGTVLEISLPQGLFDKLETSIKGSANRAGAIHGYSIGGQGKYIHLQMGIDTNESIRGDTGRGSRILTMKNGLAANSSNRMELVQVASVANAPPPAYEASRILPLHSRFQQLAHFFRMCVGMNPYDIGTFLGFLSIDGEDKLDSDKIIVRGQTNDCKSMLSTACAALSHANGHDLRRILTTEGLIGLDVELHGRLSFTEISFRAKWGLLAHIQDRAVKEALQKVRPSFFMTWPQDLPFAPQVHIVDTPVYDQSYCMLISSSIRPTKSQREALLVQLRNELGASPTKKAWVTEAFPKKDQMWFRADGLLDMRFKTQILNSEVRATFTEQHDAAQEERQPVVDSDSHGQPGLEPGSMPTSMPDNALTSDDASASKREAWTWLIWLRQSNEEGSKLKSTIGRQLTTVLKSNILDEMLPGDRVCVYVETCSSNKHPWQDRSLVQKILADRPIHLISVNPDRVTRRVEEIDTVLNLVAAWHTQGLPSRDGGTDKDWRLVDAEGAADAKVKASIGRQKAYGAGWHNRADGAATRLNYDVARRGGPSQQLLALHRALHYLIKSHGFKKVLLVARSCSSDSQPENYVLSTSIARQLQFLQNMMPEALREGDLTAIVEWKALGVSASKDDFVDQLAEQLKIHGDNVLVLTMRLDHMTRCSEQHSRLTQLLLEGGHGAGSFLWDHETHLDVAEAFKLDHRQCGDPSIIAWAQALQSQKRAPMVRLSWPMIQLILWVLGDEESATAVRHVKDSEEWVQSMALSSWQGEQDVFPELSQRDSNEIGYSSDTQES